MMRIGKQKNTTLAEIFREGANPNEDPDDEVIRSIMFANKGAR